MLKVTQLIGFGAASLARPRFTGFYEDATSQNSYSFTNCDIGTPASNRVVVVCVTASNPRAWSASVPTITINSVSATQATTSANSNRASAIYYASVSSGSTGITITVDFGGSGTVGCVIGVYAIYPSSSTPVDSVSNSNAGGATTITLTDLAKTVNGAAIFVTHTVTTTLTCNVTVTGETIVKDRENTNFDADLSYSFQSTMRVASTTTTDDPLATWSGTASERAFSGATWV